MQKLRPYRCRNKSSSALPCMHAPAELLRSSRRKLLKIGFTSRGSSPSFFNYFLYFYLLDIDCKLCNNCINLIFPVKLLESSKRDQWWRKLWRIPINHIGCRRCKAYTESLRQKDRTFFTLHAFFRCGSKSVSFIV